MLQFTSSSYFQTLQLTLMLLFYFVIFLFAFSSMFLFHAFYRTNSLYLYENCKGSLRCVVYMWSVTGPYQFLLGLTHRLFIHHPAPQLKILMAIEVVFMIYGLLMIFFCHFKSRLAFLASFGMSMARFLLQISFCYYESKM